MAIAVLLLTIALPAAVLALQSYAGAGAGAGGGGQFVSVGGTAGGTGGGRTQTFSLGSGFMYSMASVNPNDAASLQASGVRTITQPAGTNVFVTTTTGQPVQISTGQGPSNLLVFGPDGFLGAGAGGMTGGGVAIGPGGATQMYSFTGSPGQAFLITQQAGGNLDRVLVVFQ